MGPLAQVAELCAVGSAAGAAMSALGSGAVRVRRLQNPDFEPAVPVPALGRSSAGLAVALGVFGNARSVPSK